MKKVIAVLKYKVRSRINTSLFNFKKEKKRKEILSYYKRNTPKNEETNAAVSYLKQNSLSSFYGSFQNKYGLSDIEVFFDNENGLKYVVENNKKLYFKKSFNDYTIKLTYNQLRIEQDIKSPHCYTDESFLVKHDTILADVGSAEGYFSFQHIETFKKVYLFERDVEWIEALEATFKPWKHKVEIIRKFVSDQTTDEQTTLDVYFGNKVNKPNFYKIDVEGAEESVLNGMNYLLQQTPLQVALCTYHKAGDLEKFTRFFVGEQFKVIPNPGLMIFLNDLNNLNPPYFRTCLIKATKND